jgi:glycosyltransferase involved in cell wall biosynthesis
MATGTVTVAGNNSGYASVMRDTGALSLVTPTDTPEFARRLDLLLNDTSLRKAWLNWAGAAVKQYSYPKVVDMYEELYESALRQHAESLAHARA